ncbi:unnamed protein product [Lymnaea stagnalis]|uniref:Uncharacterized protein n=1 Tax=Lymnaea stagnalis TaxID=6523 RepID=A0AAV2HFA5_LYMST
MPRIRIVSRSKPPPAAPLAGTVTSPLSSTYIASTAPSQSRGEDRHVSQKACISKHKGLQWDIFPSDLTTASPQGYRIDETEAGYASDVQEHHFNGAFDLLDEGRRAAGSIKRHLRSCSGQKKHYKDRHNKSYSENSHFRHCSPEINEYPSNCCVGQDKNVNAALELMEIRGGLSIQCQGHPKPCLKNRDPLEKTLNRASKTRRSRKETPEVIHGMFCARILCETQNSNNPNVFSPTGLKRQSIVNSSNVSFRDVDSSGHNAVTPRRQLAGLTSQSKLGFAAHVSFRDVDRERRNDKHDQQGDINTPFQMLDISDTFVEPDVGGVHLTPVTRSKRKRRRGYKKETLCAADADVLPTNDGSGSRTAATMSPLLDIDSGIEMNSQSSAYSIISYQTLEPMLDTRSSSAERRRFCTSPNFTYDPELSSQIPYYFKEPALEEYALTPADCDSVMNLLSTWDNEDAISPVLSWSEFDSFDDGLSRDESRPALLELTKFKIDDLTEEADDGLSRDESRPALLELTEEADDANPLIPSSLSGPPLIEIDYDSYLPAHVLMHVKRDLVSVLMEYGQTREVKVSFKDMERSGPHHASRFHTAAVVDGETFPTGSGSSKKNAKKAAAAQALKIMYDRGRKNLEVVNEMAHKKLRAMSDEEVGSHAHRVVLVSRHVLDTAEETQFINYSKDKIAAAFVLEYHGKMRVVGLGTGNRCILYQHMTLDGKRIIHSHAEIIARRAFLRYLYKQLQTYNGNRSHPIFTRSDTGKLKIRDKIQVHLYISRPPCGDAAAFPTISNFPNKMRAIRKQGQLRTIIDDGEGAIPTDFPVPAGANGKERLRIMTCSDKICRWNVLGVQGALLSHFLDPIYINSLVIGSHTGDQRGHVPRAVSGRLKCGRLHEVIQRPYRINSPDIHYPHDDLADNYNITKSKQYCITWSYGDIDAEVIDAITGVTNMEAMEEVIPSRISKITLYHLFQQVCKRYGRHDIANLDYLKAKRSATTFQRMKSFVGQHLAAMGFGQWYSLQETYGTDSLKCPGPC